MSVDLRPEHRALVLAVLAKRVAEEQKLAGSEFGHLYEPGTRLAFESPLDGALLGTVQRTRPKPDWQVTDEQALREHLAGFPGCIEEVLLLPVPGVGMVELDPADELAQVVQQHAPHMLVREGRVTREAIDAAVEQSRAQASPAAPGITLVRPGGQMRVTPDKDAAVAVERLVAAGLVSWDGRPALPAGDEQPGAVAS